MNTDIKNLRALAQLMESGNLSVLEVKDAECSIHLEREAAPMPLAATKTPETAPESEDTLKSPMVGVFYRASSPEAKPFVSVGDSVKKGDVICIIEAMKLLNEISSDRDGVIEKICVDDGAVVEYGQSLFVIK